MKRWSSTIMKWRDKKISTLLCSCPATSGGKSHNSKDLVLLKTFLGPCCTFKPYKSRWTWNGVFTLTVSVNFDKNSRVYIHFR